MQMSIRSQIKNSAQMNMARILAIVGVVTTNQQSLPITENKIALINLISKNVTPNQFDQTHSSATSG